MAGNTTKAGRTRRINAEKKRLIAFLGDVDKDALKGVDQLAVRAAFLAIACEDLEADMIEHGFESEYQNGENQWGTKQSPSVLSYSSLMQRYLATMRQLIDLRPGVASTSSGDELLDYMNRRK